MADIYTFKYCENTGVNGCNQLQANSAYLGTNLDGKVIVNTLGVQEWIVPSSGIYTIKVYGAQGGYNSSVGSKVGGKGGYVQGDIKLAQGTKLYIYIGGSPTTTSITGGFNGGGNSTTNGDGYGVAGGGASDIRINGMALGNRIIVAGGGGGNSGWTGTTAKVGGDGGYIGGDGLVWSENNNNVIKATGGTQTSGGTRGRSLDYPNNTSYDSATDGSLGQGGNSATAYGGGGGGGLFGGGAGAISSSNVGSGGGGSSYANPTLFTNISYQTGIQTGHGQIIITKIKSLTSITNLQIHPTYLWYEDSTPLIYSATLDKDPTDSTSITSMQYKININGSEYSSYSSMQSIPFTVNISIPSSVFKIGINTFTLYVKDSNNTESFIDYNIVKEDRDTNIMNRDLIYVSNWDNSNNTNFNETGASLKGYGQDIYITNSYSHINTKGKAEIKNIVINGSDDITQTPDYTRNMTNYQTVDSGIIWVQDLEINKYKNVNSITTLRK